MITGPERITVTRWRCPHCGRSRSSRAAAVGHVSRCWHNPAVRSCKTCAFHMPASGPCDETGCNCCSDESCTAGIDLRQFDREGGRRSLPVGCPKWEAVW